MNTNLWMKIASVVLAFVLWVFVLSRGTSDFTVQAPVRFDGVQSGLMVVSPVLEAATVGMRTHERFLKGLSFGDVQVSVDATGLGPGVHRAEFGGGQVERPLFINFVSISPSFVTFTLEQTHLKTVPVRAAVVGIPAPGYKVLRVEVTPPEVVLEGGESELAGLSALNTEPVDVGNTEKTVVSNARVDIRLKNVKARTEVVAVRVVIEEDR